MRNDISKINKLKTSNFSRKLQTKISKKLLTINSKKVRKFTTKDLEAQTKYEILKMYREKSVLNEEQNFDLKKAIEIADLDTI
jgi:hypothetical protein